MKINTKNTQEKKQLSRVERICHWIYWAAIGAIIAQSLL